MKKMLSEVSRQPKSVHFDSFNKKQSTVIHYLATNYNLKKPKQSMINCEYCVFTFSKDSYYSNTPENFMLSLWIMTTQSKTYIKKIERSEVCRLKSDSLDLTLLATASMSTQQPQCQQQTNKIINIK